MNFIKKLLIVSALIFGFSSVPAIAGDTDPLFVNMTTDDSHRATMAIKFGKSQLDRGHPLTIFLNDAGVLVGSKSNASRYNEQQKTLKEAMSKGAVVIACPMCMKHYGVKKANLLPGIQVGNPELTGTALFKGNTKTLSW